jgi:hypothetical protein
MESFTFPHWMQQKSLWLHLMSFMPAFPLMKFSVQLNKERKRLNMQWKAIASLVSYSVSSLIQFSKGQAIPPLDRQKAILEKLQGALPDPNGGMNQAGRKAGKVPHRTTIWRRERR